MFKRYWVLSQEDNLLGPIGSGFRLVEANEHPITVDIRSPHIEELPTITITQGEWLSLPHVDADQCADWSDGRIIRHLRKYKEHTNAG